MDLFVCRCGKLSCRMRTSLALKPTLKLSNFDIRRNTKRAYTDIDFSIDVFFGQMSGDGFRPIGAMLFDLWYLVLLLLCCYCVVQRLCGENVFQHYVTRHVILLKASKLFWAANWVHWETVFLPMQQYSIKALTFTCGTERNFSWHVVAIEKLLVGASLLIWLDMTLSRCQLLKASVVGSFQHLLLSCCEATLQKPG